MTWFNEWRNRADIKTTWYKNNIQHSKYYQWPEYHLGGFWRNASPHYTKWFLPISNANIFQTDINRNLADLGGIQRAKNILEIKKLVLKIGDVSKIMFKQKTFFCMMKAITLIAHSIQNLTKTSNIWFNINISNRY